MKSRVKMSWKRRVGYFILGVLLAIWVFLPTPDDSIIVAPLIEGTISLLLILLRLDGKSIEF
jgi:hypothetical protein